MKTKTYFLILQVLAFISIIAQKSCVKLKKIRRLDSKQEIISIEYNGNGIPNIINENFQDQPNIILYNATNYTMEEFKSLNLSYGSRNLSLIWNYSLTNMAEMFKDAQDLVKVDFSEFDSSEVTDMKGLFSGCRNLASLNLSNLNTSKVKNMSSIFKNCEALSSLNLDNFDTSNVDSMNNMFSHCTSLISLN